MQNNSYIEKIAKLEKILEEKTIQLNQLYELSSEFSGILDIDILTKLLIFTIESNFLIENFALVYFEKESSRILESNIKNESTLSKIKSFVSDEINELVVITSEETKLSKFGFKYIIPLKISGKTRGLFLFGDKKNQEDYSEYDLEFIKSVGNIGMIAIENTIMFQEAIEMQKIERDLETARSIQKNLLPHTIIQPDGFEINAYSESAYMVGGDFYDVIQKNGTNSLFLAIGDVTGKGISAALLVANSMAYLRSLCKQDFTLVEASGLLNNLVYENTLPNAFITFFWGLLKPETKEFTYVNAGHNPPYLVRDNKIIKLEKGGLILGIMETVAPYESATIQLQRNDYIISFTDGATEAMNSREEEYGDERFEELCATFSNESPEEVKEKILSDIKDFTGDIEQSDDLTFMVVKVN